MTKLTRYQTRLLIHRKKMDKKRSSKWYDDYLPGETRERYTGRRARYTGRRARMISRGSYFTIAKPKTKEYRRFLKYPQFKGHIKYLDSLYPEAKAV